MTTLVIPTEAPAVPGPPQGQWRYADWAVLLADGNRYEIIDGALFDARRTRRCSKGPNPMQRNAPKKITVSPGSELAALLADAAATGDPILVDTGQAIYPLYIGAKKDKRCPIIEQEEQSVEEMWASYDPARVRTALCQSAGALRGVNQDALLADLAAQREQNTPGRPA